MAIAGKYSQGNSSIFQAREFQAIPGKEIRYKKITDNSRQEILGKAFPSNSSQGNPASSRRDNSRHGSYGKFQRTQFLARSFHACPYKKFLESQQQAIPGKANPGNTMLGKTIPGNYRK